MTNHPHLHDQLQQYLSQYSHYCDQRHLTTLSWMVVGLLLSQSLCPCEWEPYVVSRAQQAASYQKRWSRFWKNPKINPEKLYLPLVMAAISNLSQRPNLFGFRYQHAVESVLHDSCLHHLWRQSNSLDMGYYRAQKC